MMRYFLIPCFAFCSLMLFSATVQAADMGIAVVVNDDAISLDDLNDRMNLIIVSSNLPNKAETRKKLAPQVMNALIDEQIMLQEAARLDLAINQSEVNTGFATIAQQNSVEPEKFKTALKKRGVNVATMERQIRAQLAWSKVVRSRLRSRVNISESDIDSVEERLRGSLGKAEYLVSEILLPVENPQEESKIRDLARDLVKQVRGKKAPFGRLAQQFSASAGAMQGGSLGWIQQGQMDEQIDAVIVALDEGAVGDPVRTPTGYHIVQLRKKRVLNDENIPAREQIRLSIGNERLERLQRQHLMDLRSSAFIERRLGS